MHCLLNDIAEWGWPEAPTRRLVFPCDIPKLPRPLPRYLTPDLDRRLIAALQGCPDRLAADALLLHRATGLRIGELVDLELDCVHEIPGQGAWLKVPLGKLATERMVPAGRGDRGPDRPDRRRTAPRAGRCPIPAPAGPPSSCSPTTASGSRSTCCATCSPGSPTMPGCRTITPHQLRHTYATALVNAGVSLQSLMALLGHVSAEMSLRYGRLFDATVAASTNGR